MSMCCKSFILPLFSLLCGCIAGGGASASRLLREPVPVPFKARVATVCANRTASVPVSFRMTGADASCAVTRMNAIGENVVEAVFRSGDIVAREFKKVVQSNFHLAADNETPVAEFCVSVEGATARERKDGGSVESSVIVRVTVAKADGSETCYSKVFDGRAHEAWNDKDEVPLAFYGALENVVASFVKDWDVARPVSRILRWKNSAEPQVVPPSLKSINWSQSGDVWFGECRVKCNGYEGLDAKAWANTHIGVACRTKLGGIETERVRVVYDEELFDEQSKEWRFVFRTFARTAMALSYDPENNEGVITGDIELMSADSFENAAEILKKYVKKEMESHGRLVKNLSPQHEVGIRFYDFNTDKTYNLITIKFKLKLVE